MDTNAPTTMRNPPIDRKVIFRPFCIRKHQFNHTTREVGTAAFTSNFGLKMRVHGSHMFYGELIFFFDEKISKKMS